MTVSSAQNKVSYAGDGSTTVFSVPFLFQANADITAILRDGQGVETTWVEGTDYTLTGAGNPSGGTLTATTAPGSGEKLTIKRVVPLTQETDYPEGGQFPAQSHEDALDRGTMADQQLQEQIDRAVKLKATSALSDIDFPEPGADKGVKWNAAGTELVLTADDPDVAQAAAAASATAAAASESTAAASETAAAASEAAASASESNAATSESNAATSEANAATSETNAATSKADAEAAAGAVAYKWLFDNSVVMADPGTGDVRLNNAALASVTQIAISALTADTGNPDVSDFVVTWDDSSNAPRGTITIRKSGTPATFATYSVNGAITDNGAWLQIPVAYVASNGSLSTADKLFLHFLRSGDKGDAGDVPSTRQINTGDGLSGGGDLSANRTLAIDLDTDPGLEFNAGKLRAKVAAGIQRIAAGLGLDIAGLTALTAPATGDAVPIEDVSATARRKITLANLLKVVNALTEDTTPDTAADFLLSYDASASAVKKVQMDKLGGGTGPTFGAHLSADQTFSSGVWTKVQHSVEDWDSDADYDTGNYRFTPSKAGVIELVASMCTTSNGGGQTNASAIYLNGTRIKSVFRDTYNMVFDGGNPTIVVKAYVVVNGTTDYLEHFIYSDGGLTLDASALYVFFQAAWVHD